MTDKWDSEERFKNFMSDWNSLLYSGKQIDFEHNWQVFQDKYNSIAKHSLDYIARIWIPLKEKFVSCWADKHLHLGSVTTSRIEGNHSVLKKYLKHINNDLLMSIQKIDTMLDNQVTEINALIGKETMQITHRHSNPTIALLTRKMSQHALDLFMASWWNLKLPRMLKNQFANVTSAQNMVTYAQILSTTKWRAPEHSKAPIFTSIGCFSTRLHPQQPTSPLHDRNG